MNKRQSETIEVLKGKLEKFDNVVDAVEVDDPGGGVLVLFRYHLNGVTSSVLHQCRIYRLGPRGGVRSFTQVY